MAISGVGCVWQVLLYRPQRWQMFCREWLADLLYTEGKEVGQGRCPVEPLMKPGGGPCMSLYI